MAAIFALFLGETEADAADCPVPQMCAVEHGVSVEAVKQANKYYERKASIKKDHPDWSSERVARLGNCLTGLEIGLLTLAEADERQSISEKNRSTCDLFAMSSTLSASCMDTFTKGMSATMRQEWTNDRLERFCGCITGINIAMRATNKDDNNWWILRGKDCKEFMREMEHR